MRSDLQIQASRANGSKSRGPVTEEGKLASSRNSLKHGILSQIVLLPGEDVESFEADAVDLFEEHLPVGPTEEELVEMMTVSRWRRMRVWNLEKACLTGQMEKEYHEAPEPKPDGGTVTALAFRALADNTRTLDLVNRYESRYDRQYFRAHRRLLEVQDRRMRNEPKPTPRSVPTDNMPSPVDTMPAPTDNTSPPIAPRVSAGNSSFTKRTQAAAAARRPLFLATFPLAIFQPASPASPAVFRAASSIDPS